MHRPAVVAFLTVIALLGGVASHAVHACSTSMHGARQLAGGEPASHQPCAPASERRPACCRDPALSGPPAALDRAERPALGIARPPSAVVITREGPTDPHTTAVSLAFEHPPAPRGLRAHLLVKALLI